MNINNRKYYDDVVRYAAEIKDKSLQDCLERLEKWEMNKENPNTITLYKDYCPYSFLFKQIYLDGREGIIGGVVYHGKPDKSNSYQLIPKQGWEIHT